MTAVPGWFRGMGETARRRALGYAATAFTLAFGFYWLRDSTWRGTTELHTILEVAATLLALVVGALALVRFYSVRKRLYLFIGTGFIGTGLLDGYHALVTSDFFTGVFPSPPPSLMPWSWFASRLFLSGVLWFSYLDWRRQQRYGDEGRQEPLRVYLVMSLLTLASFLFFAFVPLPRAYFPDLLFSRPEELVPGLFFLLALVGYLRKGEWRDDRFEHWLVLSLIVGLLGQVMFMAVSDSLFDAMFDAAHLLKKLSYVLVLTGLMISTYFLFRRAEEGANELAAINAALKDSESRVRAILNTVSEGIVMINERGGIESVNPAAQSMFGYRLEELLGRNVNVLMPQPYRSEHNGYLRRYLETGIRTIMGSSREVEGQHRDGTVFPVDLSVNELSVAGERKFVGVVRDITQRLKFQRELLEATRMRQTILDSANLSIIATDPAGVILSFNRAAERMLGYSADEVVGKLTPAIIHDPEEVVKRAQELSAELGFAIEPGFEVFVAKTRLDLADENVWTYIRKDGSRFPVLLSVTAIRDDKGIITGFLGVAADITERLKIDRMKNEFISVVSHELRTPLTSIRGSLGLLAGGVAGDLPDKARSLIDIACNNSDRLVRLINDILDIEKIEAGKIEFRLETVDLAALVRQAMADIQGFAHSHGIDLELTEEVGVLVRGDHDRLVQIVTNLLSNAVKFSSHGAKVQVALARTDDRVRVSVRDRGVGISEEFRARIFQKFAQADGSDTRASGGTGLGLSISRALIEKMGGQIDFTSVEGEGSCFFFELPILHAVAAPESVQPPKPESEGSGAILVCEDDADVAHLLRMMLEQAGYSVDVVPDAAAARESLARREYLAMTLDLMLPGMDGLTFIRELRDAEATRGLPIIVVSAVAAQGRKTLNGDAIGIVDWLQKPIDQQHLLTAVGSVAREHEGRPRVLHVEDDPDIRQVVSNIVAGLCDIEAADTLAAACERVAQTRFDLVILDLGLPDGDGMGLLPVLREHQSATPVALFSARDCDSAAAESLAAVLVKSRTSNDRLLDTIERILARSETAKRPLG